MPGIWHNDMESRFPSELSEIKFETFNSVRIADVLLSSNRTLEIQHSFISSDEINKRFNDWNSVGKEIIWLLDGNDENFEQLSSGNYLIIFNNEWKYKSFIKNYDYILLEIDSKVFKIHLKKVKCKMIELKEYKHINKVVEILKTNPEYIWNEWAEDNVIKCKLTVYQQGAGNGKTYSIWKSICENIDKKVYILITKQHSAKIVIYNELNDQEKRNEYFIENLTEKSESLSKHIVIKYIHKISKRECVVIIGTIDSFCCNLSNSIENCSNFFEGVLTNIINNGMSKVSINGFMKFGGESFPLNKQSEIWIDEGQDLPNSYLYAMTKLMLDTNCDINIVGDKLQSLEYPDNFLTSVNELPNIEVIHIIPININRRIKVNGMHQQINKLVNYNKYHLPEIKVEVGKVEVGEFIEIIEAPKIYANDTDDNKVNQFIDKIIKKIDYEVTKFNYLPKNFMFIFPIMKGNILASELHTKLQNYWVNKLNEENYTQYVYLHKHTEGTCINTNDSVNASRIMSIRSAKGDGREVVFILNVNETSLKLVSNKEFGLVYESHFNVALTRAKNKIYFGLLKNNDEIHRRFGDCGYTDYLPGIKSKIQIEQLKFENLINLIPKEFLPNIKPKELIPKENIDWGYHCIKYYTYFYRVVLNIIKNNDTNSQLFVVLDKLSKITITKLKTEKFYDFLNNNQFSDLHTFPLCELSTKPKYKEYLIKIEKTIKNIQNYIKQNVFNLTIYESIILVYMIQLYTQQKYADMNPVDIYNITDFFEIDNSLKEKNLLNLIENVDTIIDKCLFNTDNHWSIFKHIALKSNNDDFTIHKMQFPILGYNKTDITHIILKSDINSLNYHDTMVEVLLERYLIYNCKSENDNLKYFDKKINTYIFLLNINDFIKIDWDWDKKLDLRKEIKNAMVNHFSDNQLFIYLMNIINKKLYKTTPFEYIYTQMKECFNYPNYIIKFFEELHEKWCTGLKNEVKLILNQENFNEILNKKLEYACDNYLNLINFDLDF